MTVVSRLGVNIAQSTHSYKYDQHLSMTVVSRLGVIMLPALVSNI